ncbi:hypothetical protein PUN28_009248 [Cardiocondyla obscurior]|uniref:Uncharacterized protein n=1 Tax=Cardiocondyla obscurior TaxID=286306 RepID=A0AAW2FWZ0_9HYME
MIITRSTVTAAAATTTTTTTTTTTATRWPLLLKRETLGRTYHNVGEERRSTADLHSDPIVSAMLSRDCNCRIHGNSNGISILNIIELQWISGSCTAIASVLLRYYYYYIQSISTIGILASFLAGDDDDSIAVGVLGKRDDADGNEASASSGDRFFNRRDGLAYCCA